MASVRVVLEGLNELRDGLKRLPADLNRAARDHVIDTAEAAAAELRASYPVGTSGRRRRKGGPVIQPGALRRGVKVKIDESEWATIAKVVSTAPHAHLWEFGTASRRTQRLWNRGRMPGQYNRGLVGIAQRRRLLMIGRLIAVIEHHNFAVQSTAA